ncbi:MAG: hypothetical protein GC171_05515 [Terrimonas sp.]|nr:hypothetical protein [Terrimonas sp.]
MRTYMRLLFFVLLLGFSCKGMTQIMPVGDLFRVLEMGKDEMKDYLASRGYILSETDSSDQTLIRYYTALGKLDSSSSVWSVTYQQSSYKGYEGRILVYRTYNPDELSSFQSYISVNGYRLSESYKKEDAEEIFYRKEDKVIHLTKTFHQLENGKKVYAYAIELGG